MFGQTRSVLHREFQETQDYTVRPCLRKRERRGGQEWKKRETGPETDGRTGRLW